MWGFVFFPGTAFDSLRCEVLLRSRRCVGEDRMTESLSQVVRWWRHWSRVAGNQPAGGRCSSLWPLIQFSAEQRGPASLFVFSPPPSEWDHHTLLVKTNLQFLSVASCWGGGSVIHCYYKAKVSCCFLITTTAVWESEMNILIIQVFWNTSIHYMKTATNWQIALFY